MSSRLVIPGQRPEQTSRPATTRLGPSRHVARRGRAGCATAAVAVDASEGMAPTATNGAWSIRGERGRVLR
jgi:hypothetical protein